MRTVIRAGVLIVGAMAAGVGGWTAYFPRSFYEDVPTVDWTPPYSEHLFRDFGGASLGLALVPAQQGDLTTVTVGLSQWGVWVR